MSPPVVSGASAETTDLSSDASVTSRWVQVPPPKSWGLVRPEDPPPPSPSSCFCAFVASWWSHVVIADL